MKKGLYFILLLALYTVNMSVSAFALSLDEAKAQGLVGERTDGYLGVVKSAAGVDALVQQINSERRGKYGEIAKKNGTTISVVEALAAKKAIENTPAGQNIQLPSGKWKKK